MGAPTTKTAQKIDRLRKLHAAGASVREIAEALDVTPQTASKWVKECGLVLNVAYGPRATRARRPAGDQEPVGSAISRLVSEGTDGLEGAAAVAARLRQVSELLGFLAEGIRNGSGNATAYASLAKLEGELTGIIKSLEPPVPLDPEKDPTNLEEADKTRAKLARLVEHAEKTVRCTHCGRRPFAARA